MVDYHPSTEHRENTRSHRHRYDMAKVVAILSYLTIVGWFIAIVMYGKHKSSFTSFHLRQSLGLIITAALLSFIPLIGWLLDVGVFIVWIIALYHACQGDKYLVPLLGTYYQSHLDFI